MDTTAPAPTVDTPVDGTTISGTAGTAPGDSPAITVIVSDRTYTTARDATGAWSVDVAPALDPGEYTVRVEQADDAAPANVGSAEAAFVIAPEPIVVPHGPPAAPAEPPATPAAPPPPPSFLLGATRGKRLTVLAACASACTVKAGRRSVSLPGAGHRGPAAEGPQAEREAHRGRPTC